MQTPERIHRFVDELSDDELPGALRTIERYVEERRAADRFRRARETAPADDEPLTPKEVSAIEEGLDAIAR